MTTRHALKELARRNIVVVPDGREFRAIIDGSLIRLITQREHVVFLRVCRVTDREDPFSDYCPGFLVHSMPELFRAVEPPNLGGWR